MPNVAGLAPTAMTSLSYGSSAVAAAAEEEEEDGDEPGASGAVAAAEAVAPNGHQEDEDAAATWEVAATLAMALADVSVGRAMRTVLRPRSTPVAEAWMYVASALPSRNDRIGSMMFEWCTVPTVAPARSGVYRKNGRGDTTVTS